MWFVSFDSGTRSFVLENDIISIIQLEFRSIVLKKESVLSLSLIFFHLWTRLLINLVFLKMKFTSFESRIQLSILENTVISITQLKHALEFRFIVLKKESVLSLILIFFHSWTRLLINLVFLKMKFTSFESRILLSILENTIISITQLKHALEFRFIVLKKESVLISFDPWTRSINLVVISLIRRLFGYKNRVIRLYDNALE